MTGRKPRRPAAVPAGGTPQTGTSKTGTSASGAAPAGPAKANPANANAAKADPAKVNPAKVQVLREETAGPRAAAGPTVLHFPEPARRRIRRRLWMGTAAVLVLAAAAVGVLVFSPLLAVKSITVQGTSLVPSAKVDELLAPLAGTPLPQVTESEVRTLLSGLPAVADVKVEARPPSELAVRITERVPVAVLRSGKRFALIDAEGRRLTSVKSRDAVKLPLIDAAKAKKDPEVFKTITAVLGALPQKVLARLDHASAKSVDSVQLELKDGTSVLWGNAGERVLKAKVLEALLNADPEVPIQVYDVSTPTRPVTR